MFLGELSGHSRHRRMNFLSELRHPTTWYSKLAAAVFALAGFTILATAAVGTYLVYHVVAPVKTSESVELARLPGSPQDISYDVAGLGTRGAWFFPGLKTAPTIVLCPGYAAAREELLPLATGLQDHGYNVQLFDFAGRGANATYSTLGFREIGELRSAIAAIAARPDVDRTRFGLWGTDVGAYAAVGTAEVDPRIRALAVESVYDRPEDMLGLLLTRYGMTPLPFFKRIAEQSFLWFNFKYRLTPSLLAGAARLGSDRKLFLEAADEPSLMAPTHELYLRSADPKEEVVLTRGNYEGMLDEDKRTYENRIISFFLLNMPP
jgi:pimeloyl-ACP methyl ester carboxylesterase